MSVAEVVECFDQEPPAKKQKQHHSSTSLWTTLRREDCSIVGSIDEQTANSAATDNHDANLGPCQSSAALSPNVDTVAISTTSPNESILAQDDQLICMGMINFDAAAKSEPIAAHAGYILSWNHKRSLKLSLEATAHRFELSEHDAAVLLVLCQKAKAELEFVLSSSKESMISHRHMKAAQSATARISINIYGSRRLAEPVGRFLQKCSLYLQEPVQCARDVEYINPHCLPPATETPVTTSMLKRRDEEQAEAFLADGQELFAELGSDEVFEEASQPRLVRTSLYGYQKRALTFMLSREQGWNFTDDRRDVWRRYQTIFGVTRYQNNLSRTTQGDPPTAFRGGILADDMGVGKTLTVLSLVASEQAFINHCCGQGMQHEDTKPVRKGTLIVMPLSLLSVWDGQIKEHLDPSIKHLVYYRIDRWKTQVDLYLYDIVITTYNVLASEWKAHRASQHAALFGGSWHRVVLDEAHMIRARDTRNSRAACALDAIHRWCVTGTPLQNRLGDISTLLKFLRADPYDKAKHFEADIIRPWKDSINEKPLFRLQSLMRMLALRRSKSVVNLPTRHNCTKKIAFNEAEAELYSRARQGAIMVIDQAIASETATGTTYLNAFQRINGLRSICNHGMRWSERSSRTSSRHRQQGHRVEAELEHLLDNVDQACLMCGTDIEQELEESNRALKPRIGETADSPRLCRKCLAKKLPAGCSPLESSNSPMNSAEEVEPEDTGFPSKIQAIVLQLEEIPLADKCIIFSFWTSTLNIIQEALDHAGISCCRYDGSLAYEKRKEVVSVFKNDSTKRAMLISITCGGQGLDLTMANHAFLVEPQWNPMVEEQAISRVWRLRQEKDVQITRFVMKETWEEKVMTKQERKRALADLVMGKQSIKDGASGKKQLAHLRELVCF